MGHALARAAPDLERDDAAHRKSGKRKPRWRTREHLIRERADALGSGQIRDRNLRDRGQHADLMPEQTLIEHHAR